MKYYRLSNTLRDLMNHPTKPDHNIAQSGGANKKNASVKNNKKIISSNMPLDYSDIELEKKFIRNKKRN